MLIKIATSFVSNNFITLFLLQHEPLIIKKGLFINYAKLQERGWGYGTGAKRIGS